MMQQQPQQIKLNKTRGGLVNQLRFNSKQNQVLYYFRAQCLNKMRNGEEIDLSNEMDLDTVCNLNYKYRVGETVFLVKDRFVPSFQRATILQEIDEII